MGKVRAKHCGRDEQTQRGDLVSGKGDQLNAGRGSMKMQIRELALPSDMAPF